MTTETENPYRKRIKVKSRKRKSKSRVWKTRWVKAGGPAKAKS
jgi:hypothetical protein